MSHAGRNGQNSCMAGMFCWIQIDYILEKKNIPVTEKSAKTLQFSTKQLMFWLDSNNSQAWHLTDNLARDLLVLLLSVIFSQTAWDHYKLPVQNVSIFIFKFIIYLMCCTTSLPLQNPIISRTISELDFNFYLFWRGREVEQT